MLFTALVVNGQEHVGTPPSEIYASLAAVVGLAIIAVSVHLGRRAR